MHLSRQKFPFFYTLNPEWLFRIASEMGAKVVDNKMMLMPTDLAEGMGVFLEVMPGLSVFLIDMSFKKPVAIDRVPQDDQFIAYYDLGEEITTHVLGTTPHRAGYSSRLGMAFMDSCIPTSLLPPINARSYSLRLIISKDLLKSLARPNYPNSVTEQLFDSSQNTLYFYSHIDSRSKILLNQLKSRKIKDGSFEFHLKHTALYLLAYLIERAANFEPIINRVTDREGSAIKQSADYIMANLDKDFVGISLLAEMAGMSVSKYKLLFKKILKSTPKQFYINERLLLAQKLLQSPQFDSLSQVAYELGYNSPRYFINSYVNKFNTYPVLKNSK